jgi:hypothetical protein
MLLYEFGMNREILNETFTSAKTLQIFVGSMVEFEELLIEKQTPTALLPFSHLHLHLPQTIPAVSAIGRCRWVLEITRLYIVPVPIFPVPDRAPAKAHQSIPTTCPEILLLNGALDAVQARSGQLVIGCDANHHKYTVALPWQAYLPCNTCFLRLYSSAASRPGFLPLKMRQALLFTTTGYRSRTYGFLVAPA